VQVDTCTIKVVKYYGSWVGDSVILRKIGEVLSRCPHCNSQLLKLPAVVAEQCAKTASASGLIPVNSDSVVSGMNS
jgi:hypothetical protein